MYAFFLRKYVTKTMLVFSKPDAADVLLNNFCNETFEYITALQRHYEIII
jgi:hypothetical protein